MAVDPNALGPNFTFIVNPESKTHFQRITELSSETEGWACPIVDYDNWRNGIEDFAYGFAVDKTTGETVGSLCIGRHPGINGEEDLWAIGMYYVHKDYRALSLGTRLFEEQLKRIPENANIFLNGVLKMTAKYASKYGFDKYTQDTPFYVYSIQINNLVLPERDASIITKDIRECDINDVHEYQLREIQPGLDRKKVFDLTLKADGTSSLIAFKDEKIVGLICIRFVEKKLSVGPFYADTPEVAKTLLHDFIKRTPDFESYSVITSCTPSNNPVTQKFYEDLNDGQKCHIEYYRPQFTKKVVPYNQAKVYASFDAAIHHV